MIIKLQTVDLFHLLGDYVYKLVIIKLITENTRGLRVEWHPPVAAGSTLTICFVSECVCVCVERKRTLAFKGFPFSKKR